MMSTKKKSWQQYTDIYWHLNCREVHEGRLPSLMDNFTLIDKVNLQKLNSSPSLYWHILNCFSCLSCKKAENSFSILCHDFEWQQKKMFFKSVAEGKLPLKTIVYTCSHDTKKSPLQNYDCFNGFNKKCVKKGCSEVTEEKHETNLCLDQ